MLLDHFGRGHFVRLLKKTIQVLLFSIFGLGGLYRLLQPIEKLSQEMFWVSFFDPLIVRAIACIEVLCGLGLILPLLFEKIRYEYSYYSSILLIGLMFGAAVTHVVIGDYEEIFANLSLIAMLAVLMLKRD